MEKKLTDGSVFCNILIFSLPYLLSYLLQTLYGMADLYIIGQFGGAADIREHQLTISGFSGEITMFDYGLTNDIIKFVTEISIPITPPQGS